MDPIRPKNSLTEEAREALGLNQEPQQNGHDATDSATNFVWPGYPESVPAEDETPAEVIGDIFDAEIIDEGKPKPLELPPPRDAKTGPPSLDEWLGFFNRVVLRLITDWYISWAFRGVDGDALSDRELERLKLTEDERDYIARPLAELSNKSKFMRKRGRTIVASADAFYSLVVFGAWASRVNRIARRHRPTVVKPESEVFDERSGQTTQNGTTGGRIHEGFTVFNPGSS